jgi:hypothetical protein
MALVVLNPGNDPIGQYDALDGYLTTVKGGEVITFTTVSVTADKAAADAADGYINPGTSRAVLTTSLGTNARPLMLCDDGLLHYGTLFGEVVGGTVGQTSFGPNTSVPASAQLGPHTALGSGKWSAWDKPGLYGATLDAVDAVATTGLQPTNATLVPGAPLYATTAGILTPNGALAFETNATAHGLVVANFIEFRTTGSLVSTPNRLVSALNSPSSTVGGVLANQMYMAVFHWNGSDPARYQ